MSINKAKIKEFFNYKNLAEWVLKNNNGGNDILSDVEFSFLDILAEIQFLDPTVFPEKQKYIDAFETKEVYDSFLNQVIISKNQ